MKKCNYRAGRKNRSLVAWIPPPDALWPWGTREFTQPTARSFDKLCTCTVCAIDFHLRLNDPKSHSPRAVASVSLAFHSQDRVITRWGVQGWEHRDIRQISWKALMWQKKVPQYSTRVLLGRLLWQIRRIMDSTTSCLITLTVLPIPESEWVISDSNLKLLLLF